ncbi:hypothetical protein GCM10009117_08940 [Gangjinia marincola]|uniref:Uncharacterized protein n=1 Tax=Gangjinia marincola TaxID=578463 RepID=A0ABP3XU83_9FLAO
MSYQVNFVNESPHELSRLIRSMHRDRIAEACKDKGLPYPQNPDWFLLWVRRGKICLAYRYTKGGHPTELLDIHPVELPQSGWTMHLTNK